MSANTSLSGPAASLPHAFGPRSVRELKVTLGNDHQPLGKLKHFKDRSAECSQFTFDPNGLMTARSLRLSADLRHHTADQWKKAPSPYSSPFFAALTDTLPDGFALSVMHRAFADRSMKRQEITDFEPSALERLCVIPDRLRLGALRVQRLLPNGRTVDLPAVQPPTEAHLSQISTAAVSFEQGHASAFELQLLMDTATALGGIQPKISFLQPAGRLAVAKLTRVVDKYPAIRAEAMGFFMARQVGIQVPETRILDLASGPALIIDRFDRTPGGERLPYVSAKSLLLAEEGDSIGVLDLLNVMRACCQDFKSDAQQLWRRLMFGLLVNRVQTDLRQIGFVHTLHHGWHLAPAVGLGPVVWPSHHSSVSPSRSPCLKLDVSALMHRCTDFELSKSEAGDVLRKLLDEVLNWRTRASYLAIGMNLSEIALLESVMNNLHIHAARKWLG